MLTVLLPTFSPEESLDEILKKQSALPGTLPFNNNSINFVGKLSRRLLSDSNFRQYPELMAMAHWFRPASLKNMRQIFFSHSNAQNRLRRGVVFHIAPSNVDSVFIYSWLLSLLCGNSNIVRVSGRRTQQLEAFFSATAALFKETEFKFLASANLVLSYEHNEAITSKLSANCHMRVIWGGDSTVNLIRAIKLPPLATELAFPSRFSIAVIDASVVAKLDDDELTLLGEKFYNDAFWFNQKACSSPRVLIWLGDTNKVAAAQARFWPEINTQVVAKNPENLPDQVISRATTAFLLAGQCNKSAMLTPIGAIPSRLMVNNLSDEVRLSHDGNGLFIEMQRNDLSAIASLLTSRDQTIAYFGITREQWVDVLNLLPPHAADRIVPIGQALHFNPVWDGVNLLQAFTREVQLIG